MKNVAEFTIIGRVGARKTLGKAVRVQGRRMKRSGKF